MQRRAALALVRGVLGVAALGAATVQIGLLGLDAARVYSDDFLFYLFSYYLMRISFAMPSAVFAAVLLVVGAVRWRRPRSARLDSLRGAAVVYMSGALVFFAMSFQASPDVGFARVDQFLFIALPFAVAIDWLIDPPPERQTIRQGLRWFILPAAYVAAWTASALSAGGLGAAYAFPVASAQLVGFMVLVTITIAVGNALGRRHRDTGTP